jgi:hypothetical protein
VQEQTAAVLDFMSDLAAEDLRLQGAAAPAGAKRLRAWQRLRGFLCGPVCGPGSADVRHRCNLGCHSSSEAVITDAVRDMTELFLAHPPAPPAFNKWTRIWPCLSWFTSFANLHGILRSVADRLLALADAAQESDLAGDLARADDDDDILVADASDSEIWRRRENARLKKSAAWLSCSVTPQKLLVVSIPMQFAVHVLGAFFEGASRYTPSPHRSILPLLRSSSPAQVAVGNILELLGDPDAPAWRPLVLRCEDWDSRLQLMASVPCWTLAGQLYKRFIWALRQWPWRLAQLVTGDLSMEAKQSLAQEFWEADECCLPRFALWLRSCVTSQQEVRSCRTPTCISCAPSSGAPQRAMCTRRTGSHAIIATRSPAMATRGTSSRWLRIMS